MPNLSICLRSVVLSVAVALLMPGQWAMGDTGDAIALSRLPEGGYKIATMWNLRISIGTTDAKNLAQQSGTLDEGSYGRVTLTLATNDGSTVSEPMLLDRKPNSQDAVWSPASQVDSRSSNAVLVQHALLSELHASYTLVTADGVAFAFVEVIDVETDSDQSAENAPKVDILVVTDDQDSRWSPQEISQLISKLEPKVIVAGTSKAAGPDAITQATEAAMTRDVRGTTVAVSKPWVQSLEKRMVVRLAKESVQLSDELVTLLEQKETASESSQAMFADLSVRQLNFRPSNGTHTPRWNAEHMMGRELLFFSQIYSAVDSAIAVADLNPKQMPPDYRPRHADWTGYEEASQMQRVADYTRRFSYLLSDMAMDKQAPGSNWTLAGLLKQMQRHYGEHTANTKQKFKLPDWPTD